ncbi:MAG TPA: DNA ligase D [Luteitalea sp.]|nr:DNA ligase D [Luteitalea sp.]
MARTVQPWRETAPPEPMLATPSELDAINLASSSLLYEQKFDGIRAIAVVEPAMPAARVQLWSRNGNDKAAQFPDIVRALRELSAQVGKALILDGEIVALDSRGRPTSFTALQSRMHLKGTREIEARTATVPTALIVFDLLREGAEDLRSLPLAGRRVRLEYLLHVRTSERLREATFVAGDGRQVLAQAEREDWEGLIVKDAESTYTSGLRSRHWRKVKLHKRATLVIGGWTDPKGTRAGMGALMVGSPADARGKKARPRRDSTATLCYAGNVGTGFSDATITDLMRRLTPIAATASPFVDAPKARGQHFVEPRLLCEVRFSEWTPEGRLRHPVYLGLRDDVGLEAADRPVARGDSTVAVTAASAPAIAAPAGPALPHDPAIDALVDTLRSLEDAGRDGSLTLPGGATLDVTNLRKVFWPASGHTKGDLLRYYARISPWLLPVIADRPLVMKRYPNGVLGKAFYQQRAPDAPPPGVRVEAIDEDDEGPMPRLIGGSLQSLLYIAQLGAISLDPWFSRAHSPSTADFVAIDLDPMPSVPFSQVCDVARWVHEALEMLAIPAALKTSGSSGLHVYIPLAEGTTYESGQLLCQIVATAVASQHPKVATVERTVAKRGRTVYVDYLQNIEGKTLACAYSARASQFAGVSTPLHWQELDEDVRPEDFTLDSVADRFAAVGDLWNPILQGPPVDFHDVLARLSTDRS